MFNSPNEQFVCKCPNCAYPTSILTSEIGEAPNDYLKCTRCKYIFSVSKLKNFHRLTQFNFSTKELEECTGVVPNQQEIENSSFLQL